MSLPGATSSPQRYAEGANYTIDLDGALALCRVRSRPDLTMLEGARLANEKVALFRKLAAGQAAAMLLDLSVAPAVIGPRTQAALSLMLGVWQQTDKPIAIVTGRNAMQQLQLRRLASKVGDRVAVFEAESAARSWLHSRAG